MQLKQDGAAMGGLNLKKYFLSKNLKKDIPMEEEVNLFSFCQSMLL